MTSKFRELCKAFKGICTSMDDGSWTTSCPWPLTAEALTNYVRRNSKGLPPAYETTFRQLLIANMDQVADRLSADYNSRLNEDWLEPDARSHVLLRADSLIGAVTAWNCGSDLAAVQRFEAIVSDLFESFVTKANPILESLNLAGKLPPLATFATEPAVGPATLNADMVRLYCKADLSIITQPIGYADHPMIWGIIAHEVGGHAVTHAIPGLAEELTARLGSVAGLSEYSQGLCAGWAEEAAADIYGLLNVGPSFALSLGAWLKMAKADQTIGTAIRVSGGELDDDHPPDLLRLYMAKGAVESLKDLTRSKADWLDDIQAAITDASAGVTGIPRFDGDPLNPRLLPLDVLSRDAQLIGAAIVTMRLTHLGEHSIQDIETWSDEDECIAQAVKEVAAIRGKSLLGLKADDAQLIAGTTMALCDDATLYDDLNERLGIALQDSYMTDRVFKGWPPRMAPFTADADGASCV